MNREGNKKAHYNFFGADSFELIKARFKVIFKEDWELAYHGFLLGNEFKYRDRAGIKTEDPAVDIAKALDYAEVRIQLTKPESIGKGWKGCRLATELIVEKP